MRDLEDWSSMHTNRSRWTFACFSSSLLRSLYIRCSVLICYSAPFYIVYILQIKTVLKSIPSFFLFLTSCFAIYTYHHIYMEQFSIFLHVLSNVDTSLPSSPAPLTMQANVSQSNIAHKSASKSVEVSFNLHPSESVPDRKEGYRRQNT